MRQHCRLCRRVSHTVTVKGPELEHRQTAPDQIPTSADGPGGTSRKWAAEIVWAGSYRVLYRSGRRQDDDLDPVRLHASRVVWKKVCDAQRWRQCPVPWRADRFAGWTPAKRPKKKRPIWRTSAPDRQCGVSGVISHTPGFSFFLRWRLLLPIASRRIRLPCVLSSRISSSVHGKATFDCLLSFPPNNINPSSSFTRSSMPCFQRSPERERARGP